MIEGNGAHMLNPMLDKSEIAKPRTTKRESWANSREFVLAMLGYSIGLGTVWRFPYLCYSNGGGAFLVPYVLVAIIAGVPLYFLEISLGQFTRKSAVNIWAIIPAMKGIGYGCSVLIIMANIYYGLILAWSILYLVHSCLPGPFPWTTCGNWWNTPQCVSTLELNPVLNNVSINSSSNVSVAHSDNTTSAATEFWKHYILRQSEGIDDIGGITNWPVVLCFLLSWIVVYGCIFKGTRSSGKVVYVTATLPYVMLFLLFIRGITLEGATDGIIYFLKPNFTKLADSKVWVEAGGQIFYSYGICFTVLISFSSYNSFHNNCYRQSIFLATTCSLTSLFASFVIFCILGHMSVLQSKDISEVASEGPGLVFIVYPVGLSLLPLPRLWLILFFITLFMVGVDTQFSGVEASVTTVIDLWPNLIRRKHGRAKLTALISCTFILLAIPMLTDGGIYVFELFNLYASSGIALLWLTFFQSIAIGYMYGVDRFYDEVKMMIGYYPTSYFKLCYRYFSPAICMFIFVFYCVTYSPIKLGKYVYPGWANCVGWILSLASMVCIPGFFLYAFITSKGSFKQRIADIFRAKEWERTDDHKTSVLEIH